MSLQTFKNKLESMRQARKGSLSGLALGVVVAIVSLFIGVFVDFGTY